MTKRDLIGTDLYIYHADGKIFNLDTLLLSDFVNIPYKSKLVADYGTGNGCLLLYLSKKTNASLIGVEIQTTRANQALRNVELNNLTNRITIINQDINQYKPIKKLDYIISNPPFFKANNHSKKNLLDEHTIARHEVTLTFEQLVKKASIDLKHGGTLGLIHRPHRIGELIKTLSKYQFSIKRLRFVHPYVDKKPVSVLIEAQLYKEAETQTLPPLILYQEKNIISKELQAIYEGRSYNAT